MEEGKEETRLGPKLLECARGGDREFGGGQAEAETPSDIQAEMSVGGLSPWRGQGGSYP